MSFTACTPTFDSVAGAWRLTVASPFLAAPVPLRVLLPAAAGAGRRHRVLFVLPVEPGEGRRYGDPLALARELDLANRHQLICVVPAFDHMCWYGDHATDPARRAESFVLQALVPAVDALFPALGTAAGRLLLGFSKSGWGAFTLMLRHPDVFGGAASWDAPLMLTEADLGMFELAGNFGTPAQLAQYLPSRLATSRAAEFAGLPPRLVLAGSCVFGHRGALPHTESMHQLLTDVGFPHACRPDLAAPHTWNATWFQPVLEMLLGFASH